MEDYEMLGRIQGTVLKHSKKETKQEKGTPENIFKRICEH